MVGIQLKFASDLEPLITKMKEQNFYGDYLNDKPDLFHFFFYTSSFYSIEKHEKGEIVCVEKPLLIPVSVSSFKLFLVNLIMIV